MVMALSAAETANAAVGQPGRLAPNAASYYNLAITQLQQSLGNSQHAEENLLACMLLASFEISNGLRTAWLQHLNGAIAIHSRFKSSISQECAMFAFQYFSFRYVLLQTTIPPDSVPLEDILGDSTLTSRLLQSLKSAMQQAMDTNPSVAMQKIDAPMCSSIEFLQLVNRISTISALKFHRQVAESVADEVSDLCLSTASAVDQALLDMVFISETDDSYLDQCSRCFKLAARVYLRLACLDLTVTETSLVNIQQDLLQSLRVVICENRQRQGFPMWPLFIAGCASSGDVDRQIVLDLFRVLERTWPISNTSIVKDVTIQIWQSRDLNELDRGHSQSDWQTVLNILGLQTRYHDEGAPHQALVG